MQGAAQEQRQGSRGAMATRFEGRLVLIRACDYKVKVEMCPALQPPLQTGLLQLTLLPGLLLMALGAL